MPEPVLFDEEKDFMPATRTAHPTVKKQSAFAQWLIKKRIVRDEESARNFLLLVAIVLFLASVGVWVATGNPKRTPLPPLPQATVQNATN